MPYQQIDSMLPSRIAGCLRHEWLEGDWPVDRQRSAIRRQPTTSRTIPISQPKLRRRRRTPLIYCIPLLSSDARAHMPNTFKTLGQAPVNVSTGDKIVVMDEVTRVKLIEKRRQALIAMPGPDERAPESSHSGTNDVQRCTTGGSVGAVVQRWTRGHAIESQPRPCVVRPPRS